MQILPYIEQDNIYRQLDFMKSWDDPGNLKLLEGLEMPKIFELPGREAPKGHTYYRIFSLPKNSKATVGPLFKEGERGPSLVAILDGTSNTFMIVEAGEAVPWYKVDLLPYDGKLPLPVIGDPDTDRFIVAFGDGRGSLVSTEQTEREARPRAHHHQRRRGLRVAEVRSGKGRGQILVGWDKRHFAARSHQWAASHAMVGLRPQSRA